MWLYNAVNTLNRLQKTLVKFAKEEGMKMVEAIIEDVAKKTGLEHTLKVAKGFLKSWRAEKTSLMLAEDYVAQHKKDALLCDSSRKIWIQPKKHPKLYNILSL